MLLGPYMVPGFLLASGHCDESLDTVNEKIRVYGSVVLFIFGVVLMIASDM